MRRSAACSSLLRRRSVTSRFESAITKRLLGSVAKIVTPASVAESRSSVSNSAPLGEPTPRVQVLAKLVEALPGLSAHSPALILLVTVIAFSNDIGATRH